MFELAYTEEQKQNLSTKFNRMLSDKRFRESEVHADDTDGRTVYDSDFSRIAMSAPIRRLQDKTQVIPLDKYDFSRNRLTHSVEVLCIARGLALGVERVLRDNGICDFKHQELVSILQTAALMHDIGNPPFGHQGEKAVQTFFTDTILNHPWLRDYFSQLSPIQKADLQNIEGNTQGFRILCRLELAKDDNSYNLTKTTLSTIVKYPYNAIDGNKDSKKEGVPVPHEQEKFGYFEAERERYENIWQELGLQEHQRHPLTYLLEAADDIAYTVCDVEDGVRYGLITIADIQDIFRKKDEEIPYDDIKALVGRLSYSNELQWQYDIQSLRIKVQSQMIIACTKEFCRNFREIVDGAYHGELLKNSEANILRDIFKKLGKEVIHSEMVTSKEREGKEAIEYLLDGYLSALLLLDENTPEDFPEYELYASISTNYRKAACETGKNVPTDIYKKFLLVTDYIFGMTDRFLMDTYHNEEIRTLILRVKSKIDSIRHRKVNLWWNRMLFSCKGLLRRNNN